MITMTATVSLRPDESSDNGHDRDICVQADNLLRAIEIIAEWCDYRGIELIAIREGTP